MLALKGLFKEGGVKEKKSKLRKWKEKLFFGDIITLVLEAYLEFLISGRYAVLELNATSDGEIVSFWIGVVCLVMNLVLMPMAFFYMLC